MPSALARRVSEKINSPAPSPGSPRPDFLRDESSSLKPIVSSFSLSLHNISLYFSRLLYRLFAMSDYEGKREREREREMPTAHDSLRERITGKKNERKTGRCIGGRGKKKKSQGEWDIEYSFFFFLLFAAPSLASSYTYIDFQKFLARRANRASAKRIGRRSRGARRAGEGRNGARTTHGRLRASQRASGEYP